MNRNEARIQRILYADQPTVPARAAERAYIYRQLVDYALDHPDREVLLKPRHRLGEDTFHRMRHHPANVLSGVDLPANFRIDYTSIQDQLATTDLLITMSSTASLEALDRGCRVALVLDLGIHERHGNQVFLNSGLLRTFSQIRRDDIGIADPHWLGSYFPGLGRSSSEIIADRINQLLLSGERPAASVWETEYFRSAARFHRESSDAPCWPPAGKGLGTSAGGPRSVAGIGSPFRAFGVATGDHRVRPSGEAPSGPGAGTVERAR